MIELVIMPDYVHLLCSDLVVCKVRQTCR
ncbi:MAG: hypothetical protein ABIL11_19475 [Chloroflexota bacterium]